MLVCPKQVQLFAKIKFSQIYVKKLNTSILAKMEREINTFFQMMYLKYAISNNFEIKKNLVLKIIIWLVMKVCYQEI